MLSEEQCLKAIPVIEGLVHSIAILDKIPTLQYNDYYFTRMKMQYFISYIEDSLKMHKIDWQEYSKARVGKRNSALQYIPNG